MKNNKDYVVFDFETGGLKPGYHEVIQVAGKAYNGKTLEAYPPEQGGEFESLMKPMHFDRLDPGALKVNRKTEAELREAPEQKLVWLQFIEWVKKYNPKNNTFTAPVAGGKNIRNFDLKFVEVLNKLHSPKKEKTVLFNPRMQLELEDIIFFWFEGQGVLPNMKMDTLRDYFGMSTEGAHDALVDVRQTGHLLMRFLKLHRNLQSMKNKAGDGPFIRFEGCCKNEQ